MNFYIHYNCVDIQKKKEQNMNISMIKTQKLWI